MFYSKRSKAEECQNSKQVLEHYQWNATALQGKLSNKKTEKKAENLIWSAVNIRPSPAP